MKKAALILASLMMVLLSFTSCTKEKDEPVYEIEPEEYKEEAQDIIKDAVDIINGTVNGDLIKVVNRLKELLEDSDFENIDLNNLKLEAKGVNPFEEEYGTHVYGDNGWEEFDNPDGIKIVYPLEGKDVVWEILPSKDVQECRLSTVGGTSIQIAIPTHFPATIKWGSKIIYSLESNVKVSSNADSFNIDAKANIDGTEVAFVLDVTPSHINLNVNAYVGGQEIIGFEINVNGNKITDLNAIFEALMNDEDPDAIFRFLTDAKGQLRFKNEIVFTGSCSNIPDIMEVVFNRLLDEYPSQEAFEEAMNKVLNSGVSIDLCYMNGNSKIAHISTKMENGRIEFYVTLTCDGSTMRLEEYFDQSFLNEMDAFVRAVLGSLEGFLGLLF